MAVIAIRRRERGLTTGESLSPGRLADTLAAVRIQASLVEVGGAWRQDVLIEADPESPVREVIAALSAIRPGRFWLDGHPLGGDGRIGDRGLRDGATVLVTPAGAPEPTAPDGAAQPGAAQPRAGQPPSGRTNLPGPEVAVVSGPEAGTRFPLTSGTVVVGRDPSAAVRLADSSVSRLHARLTSQAGTWVLEDLGSANGTWVNGQRIAGPVALSADAAVEIGSSILELRTGVVADADVHATDDGTLEFNRPPRLQPALRPPRVQAPARPLEQESYPFPWVQAVAPLLVGGLLFLITEQVATLAFIALSPLLVLSNTWSQRRRSRAKGRQDRGVYAERVAAARAALDAAAADERRQERARWLDPAATAAVSEGPTRRLWERRPHDLDALVLRVGVNDRPASVQLTGADPAGPVVAGPTVDVPELFAMPVTVDLKAAGVLGLAGPDDSARALGRWLVVQLATWHPPRTLEVYLLTTGETAAAWDWVRWLPQARSDVPGAPPVRIGNDQASRGQRLRELLSLLEAREASGPDGGSWTPAVVVVLDGVRALRAEPGAPRLLRDGPARGIYAIGIDHDPSRLAEEGRAQVVFDPDGLTATVTVDGHDPIEKVLVDQVSPAWAEAVARQLAPLRDAGGEEAGAVIPSSVRFVDLVGVDLEDPAGVVDRWRAAGRTTRAPVGVSIDGTFYLDLERDGPHGLVAGTTGSGKSEFLQTLVASLALANRPDAIQFVLVDYKGASAFADCAALPHTVGLVTNLDGRETQRALASLDAELRRRETCLHRLRAADVNAAWEHDPHQAAAMGLARLVLVIDEFAELVHELPDFVTGLIRIARVGRSLGVHLILATQRPAGVVTGEMRANTGLRVALRMEDAGDSLEVLESGYAAGISRSTPGRAYARTGGGAQTVAFQAARVAGRKKGASAGLPPPQVVPVPWPRLGYPVGFRVQNDEARSRATDLHALVALIARAAEAEGIPPGRTPWMEALPLVVGLEQLPAGVASPGGLVPVAYGLEDRPHQQTQGPALFHLEGGSHLAVAGAARSGRSTLLRTLAASLARSISPDDVHLYGLDFGNGALLPLTSLPHCGAVVLRSEGERVERLVNRLLDEVARRQEMMARQGFGDVTEQRAAVPPGERLPYLVLLLDRWEGFMAAFPMESGSPLPAAVGRLVREGPGAGVRVVLSGDRGLLTDRLAAQMEERLVLRLADRDDYRLAGINPRDVATDMVPGRALRADSGVELQVAVLDAGAAVADPAGRAQAEAVRAIAADAAARWPPPRLHRPLRVDTMPATISPAEVEALAAAGRSELPGPRPPGSLWVTVGVGGDELTVRGVDLAATGGFVVAGPARSGRSTALLALARSAAAAGATVVAICPRPSPLAAIDHLPHVTVLSGIPGPADVLTAIEANGGTLPTVLLVDDADTFAGSEADEAVRAVVRGEHQARVAVVAAGPLEEMKTQLRGVIAEARRTRAGLLLSPASSFDGDLVGVRLVPSLVGRQPAGRGCLARRGECLLVQVPLA